MRPQHSLAITPAERLAADELTKKPVPIIGQAHALDAWLKLLERRLLDLALVDPNKIEQFLEARKRVLLDTMAELLDAERARVMLIHQRLSEKHGTEVQQFSSVCLVAVNHPGMEPQPKER
jgi:hypothetical protein